MACTVACFTGLTLVVQKLVSVSLLLLFSRAFLLCLFVVSVIWCLCVTVVVASLQAQSAMDPLKGTLNRIMSSGGIKKRE